MGNEKERISITIDKDVLSTVDSNIDGTKIRSRSHAIEFFLSKALCSANSATLLTPR